MSNVWEFIDFERSKNFISVDNSHSLQYIRKQNTPEKQVVLTVTLPYSCLYEWHQARLKILQVPCSYITILNGFLFEKTGMKVREDAKRVEGRLRRACSEVKAKFVGKNGRAYTELKEKEMKVAIQLDDLKTLVEEESVLEENKSIITTLQDDNKTLSDRCDYLTREIVNSQDAVKLANEEILKANAANNESILENQKLHQYIEKLGQELEFQNNNKEVTEVGERQQRRKLKELKTKVKKALWFSETFGLQLESVNLSDKDGIKRTLSYSENSMSSYKDLSAADQQKVKNVLFILDKFCIGDAAYHELTMVAGIDKIPRSYLIKQCKEDMNKMCYITRTPGLAQGAQLDFKTELVSVVQNMIVQKVLDITDPNFMLEVKLSGDGAKMSRLTSFVVISFSVLNNQVDVMSSKGNHTVAVIKGQESYELLQSSCAGIFGQVNDLVKSRKISIHGKDIPVNLYLGGDYKFLLLVMGMKSATSDFACIWCKVHKKDRCDMTKVKDYYWGEKARSIDDIKECAMKSSFSCAHKPLLDIPLGNVVLDELHLMLRVTDKLTKNLVLNSIEQDRKENMNKRPMHRTDTHLQNLVKAICSCGVSFNVWEKMDGDGKASGHHDFTSLMGSDKRLLLQNLSKKLPGIIEEDSSEKVIKLWQDFNEIYEMLRKQNQTDQQITEFFNKAVSWVKLLTSLEGYLLGYTRAVTPYMHAMVYHVPKFMHMHKGIKKFTGQGVEKLNDDCRRIHLQRSNKWDAPKDILLVGKRVEHLSRYQRVPRNYQKKTSCYWEDGIKESRSKRHRLSAEVLELEEPEIENIDSLTAGEIKEQLKDLGVKTRYRCIKKLKTLLLTTLRNKENCPPT